MLFGQNLGGGQQGGLIAIGRGHEHGPGGHHGLAAAHIALDQPGHWHGAVDVLHHLGQDTGLSAGQLERQRGGVAGHHRLVAGQGGGRGALELAATLLHTQLDQEEFVKGQPLAGGLHLGHVFGEVDLLQRLGPAHQPQFCHHLRRDRVIHKFAPGLQRQTGQLDYRPVGDPFGQVIDRDDGSRGHRVLLDGLEAGVIQGFIAHKEANLAAEAHGSPRMQFFAHIGTPPGGVQRTRAVPQNALDHGAVAGQLLVVQLPQIGDHRHLFARLQLVDGAQGAVIVITMGQMPKQVVDRVDAQLDQGLGRDLAHAGQDIDRGVQSLGIQRRPIPHRAFGGRLAGLLFDPGAAAGGVRRFRRDIPLLQGFIVIVVVVVGPLGLRLLGRGLFGRCLLARSLFGLCLFGRWLF